jgi:hypothetical protein
VCLLFVGLVACGVSSGSGVSDSRRVVYGPCFSANRVSCGGVAPNSGHHSADLKSRHDFGLDSYLVLCGHALALESLGVTTSFADVFHPTGASIR